jgi:uncharacterized delta-60 repeat protein
VSLSCSLTAQKSAGILDPTFNNTGSLVLDLDQFDLYQDIKIQPDGKILATGTSMSPTYTAYLVVSRFMQDGSFDPDFGSNGHYTFSQSFETMSYKCLVKPDGKILIGGHTTDYSNWQMLVIQLLADGTPDPDFGIAGMSFLDLGAGEEIISDIELQPDGKILVSGYLQNAQYLNAPVIVRLLENGGLDPDFGNSGIATIPVAESDNDFTAISIQPDGKIVAAGHVQNGMSWFSLLLARFDENGILDTGYGTEGFVNLNLNNVDDEFFDLELTPENEAVLCGFTVNQSDYTYHLLVMKFDENGQVVNDFGTQGSVILGDTPYSFGDDLVIQPDGKIVIAGCTGEMLPANNDWAVWRLEANGNPDLTFGSNGLTTTDFYGNPDEALGLALYNNKIMVAGKTRNASNQLDFALARYDNDNYFNVGIADPGMSKLVAYPTVLSNTDKVNIEFILAAGSDLSIHVLSTAGIQVLDLPLGYRNAGEQSFSFSLPENITSGLYILQLLQDEKQMKSIKLVVQ